MMFDLEFERLVLQDFKNYQGTQYLELNRKPGVQSVASTTSRPDGAIVKTRSFLDFRRYHTK